MDNPFVYGEVVPAAAFVNRVAELDRLVRDLSAAQKVFLISPRRYGKSSLIRRALATMTRRGALTVDVTVSSFSSYIAFLEGYARALVTTETTWDRARTWLRHAIRSAQAEVRPALHAAATPGAPGGFAVSFPSVRSDRDVSRLAQEVFALPARLADTRRRKVIVALDEFQAVGGFNGGSVEHALRAALQHQREVGYIFAGWTGDIESSSAKLTFTMRDYLVLHANFIPNPFPAGEDVAEYWLGREGVGRPNQEFGVVVAGCNRALP